MAEDKKKVAKKEPKEFWKIMAPGWTTPVLRPKKETKAAQKKETKTSEKLYWEIMAPSWTTPILRPKYATSDRVLKSIKAKPGYIVEEA